MAEGFEIGTAFVKISPDLDGFAEELESKVEEATAGAEGKVRIGADDEDLQAALADARAKLDELDGKTAKPAVTLDDEELLAGADDATAKLEELDGKSAAPTLVLDAAEFDGTRDDATAKLDELDGKEAMARLGLDKAEWDAGIAEANAQLDELKAKASSVRLGGAGGLSGGGGEGEGGGSLFGALTLGIGGLLPGIAGAGTGLGLLGGTGALAFGGIAKALSAAHQASQNVGLTPQQVAAQQFSNQVQVQQAQVGVTQAKQQQAQDTLTANNQIQSSEMNLAEVQRNTAASQVQAIQSVTQAKQQVETATYSLSEAEYNYSQAVVQARQNIISLNDQLADSKLSVESASLAVQQAEYQERLTSQSAYSTSLDRQQAVLAVAQAKQQLQDATDQESASQYNANLANKQGVNGSQQVIQAKQAVTSAQYQMTDAQNAYSQAQTNLTNTELNNQAQLRQAQMQVSQAQEQAAYQARQDAQAVANAERNLTNTIKEQQLQWAATQSTANQALNQFRMYMARLTPAGRSFVNEILGMRGQFRGLEADAQNATLPGFTVFLKGVASLAPEISRGVTGMGSAISRAFSGFGKELQTPQAARVLNGLITNGMEFVNTVLPAVGRAVGAIFNLGSGNGAATGLSQLLKGLFDGVAGFANGLKPYIPAFNQFFEVLGKIGKALGPAFAQDIGLVAKALEPLAAFLNSKQGQPFLDALAKITAGFLTVKGLAKILPGELGKAVGGAPGTVLSLVAKPLKSTLKNALSPIFKSAFGGAAKDGEEAAAGALGNGGLSGMVGGLKNMLTGLPGTMSSIVGSIREWGVWSKIASGATKIWTGIQAGFDAVMDANPIALVVIALAGLVAGVVEAYKHFAWFRNGVNDAFHVIGGVAGWLWHNVFDPAWHGIAAGATWLYDNVIRPLWDDWLKPVFDQIESGVDLLSRHWKQVWAGMSTGITAPVNFVIQHVYDDGIAKLWNDVVGVVGLKTLRLPTVPALAGGGVLPGYSPGHDTVPAMLSPGEAVLTPGATRAIGGAPVVNALNAAYAPSSGSRAPGHYSFGVGSVVKSLFSGGEAVAKAVAALTTGNTTAFVNALAPSVGTSASGALGRIMVALPKTLLTDAAKAAIGMMSGGSAGPVTGNVASWMQQGVKAAGVPVSWIPDLEVIAQHESSDNPGAQNNWDSNAAAGNNSRGLMQLIPTTFAQFHAPGTSLNIFDPVANIAAGARYIEDRYGTVGNVPGIVSLNRGGQYVGYDSGGVLPTGMTRAVNASGKPEAVLTNDQWETLRHLAGGASGGASREPVVVTNNWYGPQLPSHEQMQQIEQRLSLAVSGG